MCVDLRGNVHPWWLSEASCQACRCLLFLYSISTLLSFLDHPGMLAHISYRDVNGACLTLNTCFTTVCSVPRANQRHVGI